MERKALPQHRNHYCHGKKAGMAKVDCITGLIIVIESST
jgi:hypothetical protein